MITIEDIKNKTNNSDVCNQELLSTPTSEELEKHKKLSENTGTNKSLFSDYIDKYSNEIDFEPLLINYLLASKSINKLKRTEIGKKIIDACDIDWTGYRINFQDGVFNNSFEFKPQTTYEMLDLIFYLLQYLNDKINKLYSNGDDVFWNDTGNGRINTKLDWNKESTTPIWN